MSPWIVALAAAAVCTVAASTPPPGNPSIAIFASPSTDCGTLPTDLTGVTGCVFSTYVRWLEAAGIRVVPLQWDAPLETKRAVMQKVNGVLFAGGSLDEQPGTYALFKSHVCDVVNIAKAWNKAGDRFVVWGTCQGFQMLCACAGGSLDVVSDGYTGLRPKMIPINYTAEGTTSRFLGSAPQDVRDFLTQHDSTLNYHHEGVRPELFLNNSGLRDMYRVTSTNVDLAGRPFVSTMEALDAPFYGVQWHPEWPPFDWSNTKIVRTNASVSVTQWASRFLRGELIGNNHSFPSPQVEETQVIEQLHHSYRGYGTARFWLGAQALEPHGMSSTSYAIIIVIAVAVALLTGVAGGMFIARHRTATSRSAVNENYAEVH